MQREVCKIMQPSVLVVGLVATDSIKKQCQVQISRANTSIHRKVHEYPVLYRKQSLDDIRMLWTLKKVTLTVENYDLTFL